MSALNVFPRVVPLTSGAVCAFGGFRDYPGDTLARLQTIRQLKEIGFTLAEFALPLAEGDAGQLDTARMQALAARQLLAIDTRIANLEVVRRFLAAVAAGDMTALNDPECSFLVRFLANGSRRARRQQA